MSNETRSWSRLNRFGRVPRKPEEIVRDMQAKEARKRAAWDARKAAMKERSQCWKKYAGSIQEV